MDDFWKEDTPKFTHDCDNCKYLGWYMMSPRDANDLYICIHEDYYPERKTTGSFIRRFGNESSEYWSISLGGCLNATNRTDRNVIRTAIKRAIQMGYITANMALELLKHM